MKEFLAHSNLKLTLLVMSVLTFIKESMLFQNNLQTQLGKMAHQFLHPFTNKIISLSGFIYTLFRLLFLNYHDIRIVQYENGFPMRNISRQEFDWCSYWIYKHTSQPCLTAFNNLGGQKYFRESIPDLYSINDKTCFYYNN